MPYIKAGDLKIGQVAVIGSAEKLVMEIEYNKSIEGNGTITVRGVNVNDGRKGFAIFGHDELVMVR